MLGSCPVYQAQGVGCTDEAVQKIVGDTKKVPFNCGAMGWHAIWCITVLSGNVTFLRKTSGGKATSTIIVLAQVVQRVNSTIHRINHYLADIVVCFTNTYPLDSDLSGGWRYPAFEQLGPGIFNRSSGKKYTKFSRFPRI